MIYYDIHTHRPTQRSGEIAVVSVDAGEQQFPQTAGYYSIGVHPWHADIKCMDSVRVYANHPAIVAIGETGLDKLFAKDENEFRLQQKLFSDHAKISEEVRKPLIIHCVRAWEELLHIRKTITPTTPWIIHGFRGNDLLALQLINAGLYLSFGKLYHTAALNIAWQKQRLLTETDDKDVDIRTIYKQIVHDLNITEDILSEAIARFFKTRLKLSST